MFRVTSRSLVKHCKSRKNLTSYRAFSSTDPPSTKDEDRQLTETLSSANPAEVEQFLRRQEELQRQYQAMQKGEETAEMPPDLQEFIKSAPIIVEDHSDAQPVTPRLPRYMREEEEQKDKKPDFNDGRIQERMPLVEKIQGFDTVRTTNFHREEEKIPKRVFQGGGPIDMFDILRRRDNGEDPAEIVENVYVDYGKKHTLPDEDYQEHHKELLRSTLKYLKIPVLMRKPEGGMFEGLDEEGIEEFELFRNLERVPKTTSKWVLEDLLDTRNETSSNDFKTPELEE